MKLIQEHFEVFIYSIFHISTMMLYSFLEYKKGKDSGKENSYLEILLNKLGAKNE